MSFFNVELVDKSPEIENFIFTKVSLEDVIHIQERLLLEGEGKKYVTFKSEDGHHFLDTSYFRGMTWSEYIPPKKSVTEETFESAVRVGTVPINKNLEVKNDPKI